MNKETIKYILTDFHEKWLPPVFDRDLELPLDLGKIIAIVGIRGSGKTFLLFRTMQRLTARNIPRENIIYVNFEDDRLFPTQLDEMDLILRAYHELYPDKQTEKKYIFLDEIQQVPGWEKYVRRIHDTENVGIYITGSSSTLVSRDISTALRGRSIQYEVFPLSFGECLRFKKIEVRDYSARAEARILHALNDYLEWGGFPEIVQTGDSRIRMKILKEYVDLLLYKDLIDQYGVKNQYLLKYLLKYFMVSPATLTSLNKVYNNLKSQGVSVSKNSLYEYIEYLHDAFIIFSTVKHSPSLKVQKQNPSKYYIIDTGLARPFYMGGGKDIGRKLENAVFLHLRRSETVGEIYYYKNTFETDFLFIRESGAMLANVSYEVNEIKTAEREIASLLKCGKLFPDSPAILIMNDWKKELIPVAVQPVAAWKFLLSDPGSF